jgi:DNA-binding transcriptional regulator YiaG
MYRREGTHPMNAAEYRTLREACGLTLAECATLHGVAVRTVQSWEVPPEREGGRNVPAKAADELISLHAMIGMTVEQILLEHGLSPGRKPKRPIRLLRFQTAKAFQQHGASLTGLCFGAYCAAIARIMSMGLDKGWNVAVDWS